MIFHLDIGDALIDMIVHHAERDYPKEACGLVFGYRDGRGVRTVPMKNVAATDDAFQLDELEHIRLSRWAEEAGLVPLVLYHSHCDTAAYLSPVDRSMAHCGGQEVLPKVVHLVVSVSQGRAAEARAHRLDGQTSRTGRPGGTENQIGYEVAVPLTHSPVSD